MKIQTFSILAGTAACDAACPYCISKMTGIKKTGFKELKINWRNFHKACRLAQVSNVSTVLITGKGEPTLFPNQITQYLKKTKNFDFPLIELQTNGIAIGQNPKKYRNYLKQWYNLGLNTLAISVVHYKKEKNSEIFNKKYFNLEEEIKSLHDLGYSVRLSCLLMREYIDSIEEIKKLMEFAEKNNIEQLTLRKLAVVKDTENPDITEWCSKHVIPEKRIKEIISFFEKNAKKLMTLPHGAVIYEMNGRNIGITDCIMVHPKTDEIRTLIFFPDGHLRYDWSYGGAILL